MTLILRKLLASSSFAIASTLNGLVYKLDKLKEDITHEARIRAEELIPGLDENYEGLADTADEWIDDENSDEEENGKSTYSLNDIPHIQKEKEVLEKFRDLAVAIFKNSKGDALLIALESGFEMTSTLKAQKKAVIFTESRITQNYIFGKEQLITSLLI